MFVKVFIKFMPLHAGAAVPDILPSSFIPLSLARSMPKAKFIGPGARTFSGGKSPECRIKRLKNGLKIIPCYRKFVINVENDKNAENKKEQGIDRS